MLTISPTAALNPPCRSHENATRAMGRYGAVILQSALRGSCPSLAYVMTPKRDILMDGLRRDQMYTSANDSEDERKGMVRSGEMICMSAEG